MSNPADMLRPSCRRLRPVLSRLLLAFMLGTSAARAEAQLIPGIDEWAQSTIESGKSKWVGQRVPFPDPSPRPAAEAVLRSELWPLAVHVSAGTS